MQLNWVSRQLLRHGGVSNPYSQRQLIATVFNVPCQRWTSATWGWKVPVWSKQSKTLLSKWNEPKDAGAVRYSFALPIGVCLYERPWEGCLRISGQLISPSQEPRWRLPISHLWLRRFAWGSNSEGKTTCAQAKSGLLVLNTAACTIIGGPTVHKNKYCGTKLDQG